MGRYIEDGTSSRRIIAAAMKVHSVLGPGLLESTYEACLAHELRRRRHRVSLQLPVPLRYEGLQVDVAYRIDMLVDDSVVVEVKAVEKLLPVHEAQLLTYLRLSQHRVGLLLNFNSAHLKDGLRRVILG